MHYTSDSHGINKSIAFSISKMNYVTSCQLSSLIIIVNLECHSTGAQRCLTYHIQCIKIRQKWNFYNNNKKKKNNNTTKRKKNNNNNNWNYDELK